MKCMVKCLGIESTAHTFGCSVIDFPSNADAVANILSDSRDLYVAPSGTGIHPREASRHHGEVALSVLRTSLGNAGTSIKDIDIIAYSGGPGLGPCLRIGAVVARSLAAYHKKPLVPVNHALGHIELGAALTGASDPVVLLVSGGHTIISVFNRKRWRIFGETLDITLGQLLDQFGRQIGLGSPCGGKIESLAEGSTQNYLQLPYVVKGNDVCFSGLLTSAVRQMMNQNTSIPDLCYSLQETAFAMTIETLERAVSFSTKKEILVVGGVCANKRLCEMIQGVCQRQGVESFLCPHQFAGDNGVQIAWTGLVDYITTPRYVQLGKSFINQSWRVDSIDVNWRISGPLFRLTASAF
jgi:N6-L-threonylcarbamoyladenine synthase